MGVEFLKKVKKTIVKSIDNGRVRLATPHLFTQQPDQKPRTLVATLRNGSLVASGDQLVAELSGGTLNLCRGATILGPIENPTSETISKISQTGGVALATVARVHALSGKVDVELK